MFNPFQRPLWWLARRIYRVETVGPFEFIDMRAARSGDHDELVRTLGEADAIIRLANAGFPELVADHLKLVAAMDIPRGHIQANVRGYVHPFTGPTRNNPYVLACRLVWVATCLRLERDAAAYGRRFNEARIVEACEEAQRRFVRQFPNADEWIEYLEHSP